MSCPTRAELNELFAPGEARDPARATAVIAHVRGCTGCQKAVRGELEERLPAVATRRSRGGAPRFPVIVLAAIGATLFVLGRAGNLRHPGGVAPVSSSVSPVGTRSP